MTVGGQGKGKGDKLRKWENSVGLFVPLELHIQVKYHCHFSEVFLAEWPVALKIMK